MVCLAIRGFAEADRKAPLTQPGASGACGVRLPAAKFDKLVERGASRGCDGIQDVAQLAGRALLVNGRLRRRRPGLEGAQPWVGSASRRVAAIWPSWQPLDCSGGSSKCGTSWRVSRFFTATIAVLTPPEAPPISAGVGAGDPEPRLAHSNACLSAEVQSKC
jgi:hypothetical protein